jgi:hypothetical protein
MLRDAGVLDSNGNLTMAAIQAAIAMNLRILNRRLHDILPQHGSDIDSWRKVYLASLGGTDFVTPSGYRFELHFYRDIFNQAYTGHDFKIVFKDWFH